MTGDLMVREIVKLREPFPNVPNTVSQTRSTEELVVDLSSSLKRKFKSPKCKVLNQPDVKEKLLAESLWEQTEYIASIVVLLMLVKLEGN